MLRDHAFDPETHYLLGKWRGSFPLRAGSRPEAEVLLTELKVQWKEYRRASNPEYRIEGLRAIRRASAANNSTRLAALKYAIPRAAFNR